MTRHVQAQYSTPEKLQARIETHQKYTVGLALEPLVDEVLNLQGQENVLDVGCGPGYFLGRLAAGGHSGKLTGLDFSAGMVAQASSSFPGVQFMQGDAQNLPFADASFDVVTPRHLLHHVPDVRAGSPRSTAGSETWRNFCGGDQCGWIHAGVVGCLCCCWWTLGKAS